MSTIQELVDKRANVWAQAQEFNDRSKGNGEPLSGEDEAAWTRALADVDVLGEQIDTRKKNEALESRFAEVETDPIVNAGSRAADGLGSGVDADAEYRAAFLDYLRNDPADVSAESRSILRQHQSRAQAVGTGAAGGYSVPQGFWAKVTETQKFYAQVGQYATQITTDMGNTLPWPTNDDTGNVGALLAENATVSAGDLTFGQAQLGAYMYSSNLVLVSYQLLQDSGVDIESYIAKKLGQRLGRITNQHYTTGTGSSQPQGYITGATTGKTTASATAITFDEIIDLVHSVDVAYRMNARFAMHDQILGYVRKLKDGQSRYLWQPTVSAGLPDTILNYPYFVNNFMTGTTSGAIVTATKTMAFGDFESAFVVRTVVGGELKRLEERYADALQVGFFGFLRTDSVVQDTAAVKLMVQA